MLDQDASGHSLLDRNLADVAQETLAKAVPASLILKEFGPYRILKLLGEGGMGVVYLAERKDLGTQAAVKVLRDAWLSPARRERFASEQRTLAQLNHPLIARLYDADTLDDRTPWFVMEYVDVIPLTQYCREHECPVEQRLQLFRSVCEAVQHAHGQAAASMAVTNSKLPGKGLIAGTYVGQQVFQTSTGNVNVPVSVTKRWITPKQVPHTVRVCSTRIVAGKERCAAATPKPSGPLT